MYLLDTNVVSEFRKANTSKINAGVEAWAQNIKTEEFFVSVITIFELERGVLLKERRDVAQGAILREWLDHQLLQAFIDRTIPIDKKIAIACAKMHVPDPKSERDAFIAATAKVFDLTI
ncbi:MAG: type II toxin-antitoxin system VapC family toxin, partial [Proteobacteria bacterium]|nr:type II toxin-antitoxin system VapC family toxin [Pseudomonadota bacterium]